MKKLGLVGGLAWPSTADYYRLLCEGTIAHYKEKNREGIIPTPPMIIESLVMAETRSLRGVLGDESSWAAFDSVFRDCFNRLEVAGCEVGAIASNTPHARLHSIRDGIKIPVISILEETACITADAGFTSALVLGTAVTMHSTDYAEELQKRDVVANEPLPDEKIADMQQLIDTEFYAADESVSDIRRNRIFEYCEEYVANKNSAAVLLACTELPLAFPEYANSAVFESGGFNFVNSTVAHVDAILKYIVE